MRHLVVALALVTAPHLASAQVNCTRNPGLCNLNVRSTIDQPDLDLAIDVVLVGDGFLDVASWTQVADDAVAQLRSAPVGFTTRIPGAVNVHIVDVLSASNNVADADLTNTALGMSVGGAYINADAARVNLAALNAPDVDVVVAIANSGSGRANATFNAQLASGGAARLSRSVAVINHELGHAVFHLADEYVEGALCASVPSEAAMMLDPNVTADPSCFKFQGAGCVAGGRYCATGVYRSAASCLMRSNSGPPCPACDREITDVLRQKRTGLDLAPPWLVAIAPAVASGTVDLDGRSHDDFFPGTTVGFEIDGVYVGAGNSFGRLRFDTTRLANGPHTLVVVGSDAAGHSAASAPVTFTVDNAVDTTPPPLVIGQPTQGAVVSGRVSISATSSARDVAQIVVSIDGVPAALALDTPSLFTSWAAPTSGVHTIDAAAIDRSGNVGLATRVTVTATAPTGPVRAPEVLIDSPRDGTAIAPYFVLRWRGGGEGQSGGPIGGGGGGGTFELILDGAPHAALASSPQVIDARAWALGPHQLRVRMTDTTTVVTSPPVFVVRTTPATPGVLIASPSAYSWHHGVVPIAVVAHDDAPLTSVTVRVDGVPIGSTTTLPGTVPWNTVGRMRGCARVDAEVLSSDGGTARSPAIELCADNGAPSVVIRRPTAGASVPIGALAVQAEVDEAGRDIELRVDGVVQSTGTFFGPPSAALLANLSAGVHTLVVAATDDAGNVGLSAPVTVTAVAACTAGGCDDGNTCTTDRCAPSGACVYTPIPGCCRGAADCSDGDACSTDTCVGGTCQHAAVAGCCNHGFDCADQDACTQDLCTANTCSHPSAGCCLAAADCNDNNGCTTDRCLGTPGACAHDWTPGCCAAAADCDDGDPCTAHACQAGQCVTTPIAGCCRDATACNDGVRCTFDSCSSAHVCEHTPQEGCCESNADCATLNPCATTACGMRGTCEVAAVAGCCSFDFECDDGAACTDDACVGNVCQSVVSPICCAAPSDCDDGDVCTAEACGASRRCSHSAIVGCCRADKDCDDGSACTTERCGAAHTCEVVSSTGCPDAGVVGADADPGLDADPSADASAPGEDAAAADGAPTEDAASASADAAPASADAARAPVDATSIPDAADVTITGSCACSGARDPSGLGWLVPLIGWAIVRRLGAVAQSRATSAWRGWTGMVRLRRPRDPSWFR